MIRVAFCCHGNICRSTLAESVFTYLVNEIGVDDKFEIDSFATSREEIGNPPHRGTVNVLKQNGIPLVPHRAKQITLEDYENFDYVIGMDQWNIKNLNRMLNNDLDRKIYKMLSFADYDRDHKLKTARDVADPWYTGDFDTTFKDVMSECKGLLSYINEQHGI